MKVLVDIISIILISCVIGSLCVVFEHDGSPLDHIILPSIIQKMSMKDRARFSTVSKDSKSSVLRYYLNDPLQEPPRIGFDVAKYLRYSKIVLNQLYYSSPKFKIRWDNYFDMVNMDTKYQLSMLQKVHIYYPPCEKEFFAWMKWLAKAVDSYSRITDKYPDTDKQLRQYLESSGFVELVINARMKRQWQLSDWSAVKTKEEAWIRASNWFYAHKILDHLGYKWINKNMVKDYLDMTSGFLMTIQDLPDFSLISPGLMKALVKYWTFLSPSDTRQAILQVHDRWNDLKNSDPYRLYREMVVLFWNIGNSKLEFENTDFVTSLYNYALNYGEIIIKDRIEQKIPVEFIHFLIVRDINNMDNEFVETLLKPLHNRWNENKYSLVEDLSAQDNSIENLQLVHIYCSIHLQSVRILRRIIRTRRGAPLDFEFISISLLSQYLRSLTPSNSV